MLKGFKAGMDFALWLIGLMSGAFHSEAIDGGIAEAVPASARCAQNTERSEREYGQLKLMEVDQQILRGCGRHGRQGTMVGS